MIKIILASIQVLVLLFLVLFVVNNSFTISFELSDFIYSLSSSYVFGFLIFLFVFVFIIQTFYFKILNKIRGYQSNRFIHKQKKGYDYFTKGMVALASKDYKNASIFSSKLNNFLSEDKSLFMLLHSEVLKKTKNYDRLKVIYDEMINNQTTKELGEIGLMEYYLSLQDYHHAFLYSERLFLKNPNIDGLYKNILQIIAKTNNWSQLIQISKNAYHNKIISKNIFNNHKSIALFEIAKIKHTSELNESINLMKEAIILRKAFTPYIKFLVKLLVKNKNLSEAKKIIIKTWNENPNSELRHFIIDFVQDLNLDLQKFILSFSGIKSKSEQNQMLLTHSNIVEKNWAEARENIKLIMNSNPSKEICEFMSIIELGENNDISKSNAWKIRGENAELANSWICTITKQPQNEWSSVSKAGYFNSLEWGQIPTIYHQQLEKIENDIR